MAHNTTTRRWRQIARYMVPFLALPVLACTNHTFAPGPGMAASQFEPHSAHCRMMARGVARPQGFAVAGNERFVLAASAGMLIGGAISGAIEQNQNFNDCMMAAGWRPVDGSGTPQSGPLGGRLAVQNEAPVQLAAVAPTTQVYAQTVLQTGGQPPARQASARRAFGAEVQPIAMPFHHASYPRGTPSLVVVDILPGGAAEAAGLRRGDIILSFANFSVASVYGMQGALQSVAAGNTVPLELWRDQGAMTASVRL